MEKKNKKGQGFTLVELLVVIAIIGLLSTLSVVALNNARQRARDAKRTADVKQVQTALELFYNSASKYPSTIDFSGAGVIRDATSSVTYMAKVPSNPAPRADGDCPDLQYRYTRDDAPGTTYTIWYCLGSATGGVVAGTNCATPAGLTNGTTCLPQ
jgi:prepilin-type N-terminal cleavage/methylation domain-containing protein